MVKKGKILYQDFLTNFPHNKFFNEALKRASDFNINVIKFGRAGFYWGEEGSTILSGVFIEIEANWSGVIGEFNSSSIFGKLINGDTISLKYLSSVKWEYIDDGIIDHGQVGIVQIWGIWPVIEDSGPLGDGLTLVIEEKSWTTATFCKGCKYTLMLHKKLGFQTRI